MDNLQPETSQPAVKPKKQKKHFTWDRNNNPNWLSRIWMRKPNTLAPRVRFNFIILGFLLPFLGTLLTNLLMELIIEFQPSAHAGFKQVFSLLNSDAYHQYFPFFKAFRRHILTGESLLFNWDVGMGLDYVGLYAYYLGSPLNLLSVAVPEGSLLAYFTLLTPIRLGLAGMFFALFLQKTFRRNDFSIALFGSFYATCAWVFGYMWNSMWLDTFALLPLVVLGTVSLLRDRKYILYTVSLFFSVAINYYIGFFTCIFTLLVFICYEICRWKSIKKFLADLGLMALFTVLALGATALITLPTYASLMTTSAGGDMNFISTAKQAGVAATTTAAPKPEDLLHLTRREVTGDFKSFNTWIALFEAMTRVATNHFAFSEPNYVATEGLPNVYCGLFAAFFAFLLLTCKKVSLRERICTLGLLLFINASFVIESLNFMWHGFHTPNMIPYRFSFLYSFVLLYMAYRAWLLRHHFKLWQVITTGVVTLVSLLLSDSFREFTELLKGPITIGTLTKPPFFSPLINCLLIAAYFVALLCMSFRKAPKADSSWQEKRTWYQKLRFQRGLGAFLLVTVICIELFINFAFNAMVTDLTVDAANYPLGTSNTEKIVDLVNKKDTDPFFRMEVSKYQTLNDGALIGYNGITTFTSSANSAVTKYMRKFSFAANEAWNRYAYTTTSAVADLFLGIKYQVHRTGELPENPFYSPIGNAGNVTLLRNNYYLPLGFMVDPGLTEVDMDAKALNHFDFQTLFLSKALGRTVTPFESVLADISGADGVSVNVQSGRKCTFTTNAEGVIYYDYVIDKEGYFCAAYNLSGPKNKSSDYIIQTFLDQGNGFPQQPLTTHRYSLDFMQGVCQVKPGDRVRIAFPCQADWQSGTLNIFAAVLDEAVIQDAYQQLSQSVLQITKFDDTLIEGTVNCEKAGLLYTSIPQHGNNWRVFVDGKEAKVTLIGDAMVGVMLDAGTHTVTFRYQNKLFTTGILVSAVCAAIFGGIVLTDFLIKKKRNRKKTV